MMVIAEIGMAHDGSLGMAHAYVDAVSKAGADAVKFQCHIAEAESTPDEPWRVVPKYPQDASRFDYWKRTAFTAEQWAGLKQHADKVDVDFLCSPFSVAAVELLDPLVSEWKIPSGEILNVPLMAAVNHTRKPVIVSTGMCTWDELDEAWKGRAGEWAVLQCTSMYPCPPDRVGLGVLSQLKARFDCRVGISDHSGTPFTGLAAAALGADILEIHVCFSRDQWGFDVEASLDMADLRELVDGVWFIDQAKGIVDKDGMARELKATRDLFMGKHKRKAGVS